MVQCGFKRWQPSAYSADEPQREALDAVAHANARGIPISLIGLSLDKEGEDFGRKLVEVGGGRSRRGRTKACGSDPVAQSAA